MSTPAFDADLLRRYDRPGPRYTSYPTAPQFHERFGANEFRDSLLRSNEDPIPRRLSLYLHVPFCHSPCFYCGCNRVITRDGARAADYLELLLAEIDRIGPLIDRDREVVQLHFGGGTPNFLSPGQIGRIIDRLDQQFSLSGRADRDFSIELDPRTVTPEDVLQLAELGLNRASLGVQDYDPEVQQAINRLQSREQTEAVIAACRQAGMRSVNLDLIYGLPGQTRASFERTLQQVLAVRPERLAIYSYAHLPQLFKPQRRIDASRLPSAEVKLGLLAAAIEATAAAGYDYIGMDHFALPEDELSRAQRQRALQRNFMGYTTHADCDLIGIGVSAISHLADCFAQNPRDLPSYTGAIQDGRLPTWRGLRLDADDRLRADLIQQLMCHALIDFGELRDRHDIDFHRYFATALPRLAELQADGLLELDHRQLRVSSRGRLLLRCIAMCFDRYLVAAAATPTQFSRAI